MLMINTLHFLGISLLIWLLSYLSHTEGCVYLYGSSPQNPAPTGWDYGKWGDDWTGPSLSSFNVSPQWKCLRGRQQSPIDFEQGPSTGQKAPARLRTTWRYPPLISNGQNVSIINNGHAIQVQWDLIDSSFRPEILVPFKGLPNSTVLDVLSMTAADVVHLAKAVPYQFHFHTSSEHTLEGMFGALELHIVHNITQAEMPGCPPTGCLMVTAVIFKQREQQNPHLEHILRSASAIEGATTLLPKSEAIDLQSILPLNGKSSYLQYSGSLTTPPCSEGLLWHVFSTPVPIGKAQVQRYMELVSFKNCSAGSSQRWLLSSKALYSFRDPQLLKTQAGRTLFSGLAAVEGDTSSLSIAKQSTATARHESHKNYTCTLGAYGYNQRFTQPLLGRLIRNYQT
ncbi:hypothetical protein CEUSTIGMA_g868.t1 [Chlamydomonas eustigma]|uniref:carbonic anhydrase n=1 Tax=Chlamydomonas eustigma TaxID=1157962 RepID=A0A250WRT4_9CHLO|nr:hypothetical protein CEUSTIGMA_g868.t1 [Chlamydomonas eustigma]|eukprot:GAX73416.1 hypothetical protein CEUSTIGMA_g868.t1 [Chlamydomonas eustigma]